MDARHFLEAKTAKEQVSAKLCAAPAKPKENAYCLVKWHAENSNRACYGLTKPVFC